METTNPPLHLSQRVRNLKPSATLAVSALVRRLQAEGRDVIGFGAGEPDFDTPEHIQQAAIDALRCGTTHYMPVPGEPKARQTIADKLRDENGIACTPDDVVITVGAKHALYLALQCLLDAGDDREVIVPTPAWVSYQPMIELSGGNVVEVPGALDNDYKITPAQLEAAITPRTAVLMINSPSNPCGTMYEPDELRALAEVVEPRGQITILTDEIYEKLVYGGTEHFSPGSIGAIADRVVTVNGLSKAYAMTGWRIGYACAPGQGPGDLSLAKAMAKLQGQMTSHITSFCYAAIVEALTNGGIRCPRPTGAFYVFPDISAHVGKQTPAGRAIDSSSAFAEAFPVRRSATPARATSGSASPARPSRSRKAADVWSSGFGRCADGERLRAACHSVDGGEGDPPEEAGGPFAGGRRTG
jgi:aspartate aminotransferase